MEALEALPPPNLPLLRKVLDHVDAHPQEWNQGTWIVQTRNVDQSCGTACCIAGWASLLSGDEPEFEPMLGLTATGLVYEARAATVATDNGERFISRRAQELLGLTSVEADELFAGGNSRAQVQRIAEQIAERAGEVL